MTVCMFHSITKSIEIIHSVRKIIISIEENPLVRIYFSEFVFSGISNKVEKKKKKKRPLPFYAPTNLITDP